MDRAEWHRRYVQRLLNNGMPREVAEGAHAGGSDDHDYTADPEDAADAEWYYWCNSG